MPASANDVTFTPRTAEQRARLARIAALTAGPCPLDGERKSMSSGTPTPASIMTKTNVTFTLADAMCPPKSTNAFHDYDVDDGIDPAV